MQNQHFRRSKIHFGLIQNIEILHADVIILVEETFLLDTGHIKDIQLRENIFHFNNFLKWNIVRPQHIITDVIRETKLLRGD